MKKVIIIILLILIGSVIAQNIYIYNSHKLEVKPYKQTIIYVPDKEIDLTRKQCKKLVDDLYKTPHFTIETNSNTGSPVFIPPIAFINKNLNNREYIIYYAHELTHLKYQTANETFVTYITFKTLYESDNEILHYCGEFYGACILSGEASGTEYDCGYYILEYLKGSK